MAKSWSNFFIAAVCDSVLYCLFKMNSYARCKGGNFSVCCDSWELFLNSCSYWIIKLPHGDRPQEWLFLIKTVIYFSSEGGFIYL